MMDWTSSGIKNTFEYELIDPFDLDFSLGYLDCVTGCKITEAYRGDYRSSATLDIDGEPLPLGALVRVWHTATLGNETVRQELGTFMQEPSNLDYQLGRYTGSVPLYSTMLRLDTDKRNNDVGVPSSSAIIPHFEYIVKDSGGTPYVIPAFSRTKTFSSDRVWESGGSVLSECHECANAINGYVVPDTHGRVCLVPYQLPSARTVSFSMPTGSSSVTLLGVSVSSPDIVNRVVVNYQKDDRTWVGVAKVDATHPWHFNRIGRWAVKVESAGSIDEGADIQSILNSKANSILKENSATQRTFGSTSLYLPVNTGEVIAFDYYDGAGEGLSIKALVAQREIECTPAMQMQMILEEV